MRLELHVGVDVGTSGVRAIAIDDRGTIRARAAEAMPAPRRDGAGASQDPQIWWRAVDATLRALTVALPPELPRSTIASIAVDGTSGTLLLCTADGTPLTPGLMYNDARAVAEAAAIARLAPADSGAHGSSSALAKLLHLQPQAPAAARALHQADWIAGRLAGRFDGSDENNVLKLGYDIVERRWPAWLEEVGARRDLLPRVRRPGEPIGAIDATVARDLGLPEEVRIVAGTTDGIAAFLATGAARRGEAVTSLGSTLVIKVVAERPLFSARFGIYSHRIGDAWLAGGASNSGGAALLEFFSAERMAELSGRLDPDRATGYDYYPLGAPGERFPLNDPALASRVSPRPADDAVFFQALLEGIADIERQAYRRLEELGAGYPRSIRTVGAGAANVAWTRIRGRVLGVPLLEPVSVEAAYGAALLARQGMKDAKGAMA